MKRLVIGIALGAVLAGGAAYATIPDANGVVHGCYANETGHLRVIDPSTGDACKSNESALDWNQTGPQGQQGPRGPSDAYFNESGQVVDLLSSSKLQQLASLNLPPGKYVVSAVAQAQADLSNPLALLCYLRLGSVQGTVVSEAKQDIAVPSTSGFPAFSEASLLGTVDLSVTTSVGVYCTWFGALQVVPGNDLTGYARIAATAVGALH